MNACLNHPIGMRSLQRGGIFFRLLFLLSFLCLLFVLYLVRHPVLRLAGGFWVVDEAPQAADAIVVLGDDNYNADRAARTAQLFKAGWAPQIVVSGRFLRPYASIAELEEHDLIDRGVPQAAIIRFAHRAENTREETTAIGQLISSRGWRRILLVTSNYHTRRSQYLAERTFPAGTILHVIAAPDSDYDPHNWWQTRNGVKIFAHECVGILVSIWEMRHSDVQTASSGMIGAAQLAIAGLHRTGTLFVYKELPLYYSSLTT